MIRVGVLRGGEGKTHSESVRTGAMALSALAASAYRPYDIYIDKKGVWHCDGIPFDPVTLPAKIDVAFNGLHGVSGEGGTVTQLLEAMHLPHTSSSPVASAQVLHKKQAKQIAQHYGIRVAQDMVLESAPLLSQEERQAYAVHYAKKIHQTLPPPWVVKPLYGSMGHDVHYAETMHRLVSVLYEALGWHEPLFIETYLYGKEVLTGIVESFRGDTQYHTIPHMVHHNDKIWYHNLKRDKAFRLTPHTQDAATLAKTLFSAFGMKGYGIIELIHHNNQWYFLEANDLPSLHPEGVFKELLDATGISTREIVLHSVDLALKRK